MSIFESVKSDFASSDLVFHYTKLDTGIQYILGKDRIQLGPLGKTNDPFEYGKKYVSIASHSTASQDAIEFWHSTQSRVAWSIRNEINRVTSEEVYFLSCCSSKPRSGVSYRPGFLKMRMWAQYGESFNGICFVLSKSALLRELRRQSWENCRIDGKMIHYLSDKKNLESRGMLSVGFSTVANPEEFARDHIWKNRREMLLTKSEDFRDEAEYRIIA